MANKSTERKCSTPLVIREMQIKTKIRRHFMPTGMAVRETSAKAETLDPSNTASGTVKQSQPLWKTICQFLKSDVSLSYNTAILLLRIFP